MKNKTNFKNVELGFTFYLPGNKEVLYKKVSYTKAVKFYYGRASKTKESFKAGKVVKQF